jgi:hypothetical protein
VSIATIRSSVDPATGKAACLFRWDTVEALLQPDVVVNTARDLMAAAAGAEADVALVRSLREDIRAEDDIVGAMLAAVRRRRGVPAARVALRIAAVAGAKTGKPYVHIGRGSMEGQLTPDEAREMAQHWTQAAVAAEIDSRLRYVLGELEQLAPGDVEEIFAKLQSLQR